LGSIIALVAILAGFGIPVTAIWTSHREKMARIMAERGTNLPPNVVAELKALREEVMNLRETTTRFDMSFDAALSRLEGRVDSIETQQAGQAISERAESYAPVKPVQESADVQTMGQGR
jgi:hypothetical protein